MNGKYSNELINYGDFIHHNLKKYNKTQTDLAQELGVSQKTISRYINGENKPSKYNIIMINSYFKRLEKSSLNPGERYAKDSDFASEEASDKSFNPFDPECSSKLQTDINKFSLYTEAAQKYIIKQLPVIFLISDSELYLIEQFRSLSRDAQGEFINMLEHLPISSDMVTTTVSTDKNSGVTMFDKYILYLNTIHKITPFEGQIYVKINSETGEPLVSTNSKNMQNFSNICQSQKINWDYKIDHEFYSKINKIIDFTRMDWYVLLLLCRVALLDCSNNNVSYNYILPNGSKGLRSEYLASQYMSTLTKS